VRAFPRAPTPTARVRRRCRVCFWLNGTAAFAPSGNLRHRSVGASFRCRLASSPRLSSVGPVFRPVTIIVSPRVVSGERPMPLYKRQRITWSGFVESAAFAATSREIKRSTRERTLHPAELPPDKLSPPEEIRHAARRVQLFNIKEPESISAAGARFLVAVLAPARLRPVPRISPLPAFARRS